MIAAVRADAGDEYARILGQLYTSELQDLWLITDDPVAIALSDGVVDGMDEADLVKQLDDEYKVPFGLTRVRKTLHQASNRHYVYSNNIYHALGQRCLTEEEGERTYWGIRRDYHGATDASVGELCSLAAAHGPIRVDDHPLLQPDDDGKVELVDEVGVIRSSAGGALTLAWDPTANQRIAKARATRARNKSDPTQDKNYCPYTCVSLADGIKNALVGACAIHELESVGVHSSNFREYRDWDVKSKCESIQSLFSLAKRLGVLTKARKGYKHYLPHVAKLERRLRGNCDVYGGFFTWVDKELSHGKRKKKEPCATETKKAA